MPVSDILDRVVEITGMLDLKDPDREAFAIEIIDGAQMMLEDAAGQRLLAKGTKIVRVQAGQYLVPVHRARAIQSVIVVNSTGTFNPVDYTSYSSNDVLGSLYTAEPNSLLTTAGTFTIASNGTVTGTSTDFSTAGVVVGSIIWLPTILGGKWVKVRTVTSDVSIVVELMDSSNYNLGVATVIRYYAMNASGDGGMPTSGAVMDSRLVSESDTGALEYGTTAYGEFLNAYPLSQMVVLHPVPDAEYDIQIQGLFYSSELTALTSSSYWTEAKPEKEALAFQAAWLLEGYRVNHTRMTEIQNNIKQILHMIRSRYTASQMAQLGNTQRRY